MMRAEIRHLMSPDVEGDLADYVPQEPKEFGILVQLIAGPSDGPGEESFDFILCTPQWLDTRLKASDGVVVGRHHLIVGEFDYVHLRSFLENYVGGCSGESWDEVAKGLARLGRWEFEDYTP